MSKEPVFVAVLNWNNVADTVECAGSVLELRYPNVRLVITDNASTDDSVLKLQEWFRAKGVAYKVIEETDIPSLRGPFEAKAVLIKNQRNYGYAGGNNRALRYALLAPGGYAWVINNDTVADPDSAGALARAAASRKGIGLFGATILNYANRSVVQTQGGDRYWPLFGVSARLGEGRELSSALPRQAVERYLGYIAGASVFLRLETLRALGLMDERYFLYFEELDWAVRAKKLGLGLGYVPEALIWHKEGSTVGSSARARRKSYWADYYGVRNRLLATARLFPWALPTVYLGLTVTIIRRLLSGQIDRAWMVIKIMAGAGLDK